MFKRPDLFLTVPEIIESKQVFRELAEEARDAHIKTGRVIKSYVFNHIYHDVVIRAMRYQSEGEALDIGTALGVCGMYLNKTGSFKVTSVQYSDKAIDNGKKLWDSPGARWLNWDSKLIPAPKEQFDLVVSKLDVLHWRDPVSVFNEIHRVLKPGGVVMVSDVRNDAIFFLKWLAKLYAAQYSKALAKEMEATFRAAYSFKEIQAIVSETKLKDYVRFDANPHSYFIKGKKPV